MKIHYRALLASDNPDHNYNSLRYDAAVPNVRIEYSNKLFTYYTFTVDVKSINETRCRRLDACDDGISQHLGQSLRAATRLR
jgi:hypothetical protein